MTARQLSLWENERLNLKDSIEMSLVSLRAYGDKYKHWGLSYSGGKDSSATASFVAWALKNNLINRPQTLTVVYADTRRELPPLQQTAMKFLTQLENEGIQTRIVYPTLDHRYWIYILGRGVIAPKKNMRWCTDKLKVAPITKVLNDIGRELGEKYLMITGVRMGESAVRDRRIALSCSKTTGECGQGWMQYAPPDAIADTLAPLLHWRLCHIWDWLYFGTSERWMQSMGYHAHEYPVLSDIAAIYGGDDLRTGCVECDIVDEDKPLNAIIKMPEYAHLYPLKRLRSIRDELMKPKSRLRREEPWINADGSYSVWGQAIGAIRLEARQWGLEQVLDVQRETGVDLINAEERARIEELIALGTYPRNWTGEEIAGDIPIDRKFVGKDGMLQIQPLLFNP